MSPEAYGHFTHLLTALAGGRVILSLEGGYNVTSISHAMSMCTKALLGDPLPPLVPGRAACPSAVTSIKNVIRTQARYWSALCFQVALPQERVFLTETLDNKSKVLNLSDPHPEKNKEGVLTKLDHKEEIERDRKVSYGSTRQYVEVTSADVCHALSESLSKLCSLDKQIDHLCSDISTSPVGLSNDSSPLSSSIDTESRIWSKSSSSNFKESSPDDIPLDKSEESPISNLTEICSLSPVKCDSSPSKLSFSDDGYKSEELSDVTTFHEGTVISLSVITEEHGRMNAKDGGEESSTDHTGDDQQGPSGGTGENASGTSSQISGQQTLVNYLSENMQVSFTSFFIPCGAH